MRKTVILAAAISLAAAGMAQAHARLIQSAPKAGSTVPPPKELKITYSEGLDLSGSSVKVTGPKGAAVATGPLALDPKNKRVVFVPLSATPAAGAYRVSWTMKTEDGHTTNGDFGFSVK